MQMTTDEIVVANVKCGGCVSTIKNKLSEVAGVVQVEVDKDSARVVVQHDERIDRPQLTTMLASLGYPEK